MDFLSKCCRELHLYRPSSVELRAYSAVNPEYRKRTPQCHSFPPLCN